MRRFGVAQGEALVLMDLRHALNPLRRLVGAVVLVEAVGLQEPRKCEEHEGRPDKETKIGVCSSNRPREAGRSATRFYRVNCGHLSLARVQVSVSLAPLIERAWRAFQPRGCMAQAVVAG